MKEKMREYKNSTGNVITLNVPGVKDNVFKRVRLEKDDTIMLTDYHYNLFKNFVVPVKTKKKVVNELPTSSLDEVLGKSNVEEVLNYAMENEDMIPEIIKWESERKNRKTLLESLKSLLTEEIEEKE